MPTEPVEQVLHRLGQKTPEEIAEMLRRHGVTGIPGSFFECPIARLIRRETGFRVSVDRRVVDVYGVDLRRVAGLPLPKSVQDFVWQFDHGYFDDLVAQEY